MSAARKELTPALESITRRMTLKELRKRKISAVRVVTRSGLDQALGKQTPREAAAGEPGNQGKRIQRLLEEVEKLGQAKLALEHEKGLAESERSRLQAELQGVLNACGKASQGKVEESDLRNMVTELEGLRAKQSELDKALHKAQKQLAHRERTASSLEEKLRQRQEQNQSLTQNYGTAQRERSKLIGERDRYRDERDQYRAERDQYREERDQYRAERDRFLEERERLREERDRHRSDAERLREENEELSTLMRQARSALVENEAQLVQVRQAAESATKQRDELLVELQETQRKLHVAREELETAFSELATSEQRVEEQQVEAQPEPTPQPAPKPHPTRRSAAPRAPASFGFGFGTPRRKGSR